MWRIDHDDPERGVIAPLSAILMVALIGMAAFAVDVATMYSEHAQLQNGADSAALSIAQACAATPPTAGCTTPKDDAAPLAKGNALDGSSHVLSATVNGGKVDVTTQSEDAAGNKHFSLVFARVLGIDTADIGASAQAQFGGYSAADVVPLSFSKCESDPGFTKNLQFFPSHGNGLDDDPGYECKTSPSSGWELPGGFGWLKHPAADPCNIRVDVNNPWVNSDTGQDFDSTCDSMFLRWKDKLIAGGTVEILIPIFDISCPVQGLKKSDPDPCTPSPYSKSFRIEAFAQISIRGWHFTGGGSTYMTSEATVLKTSLGLGNSDTGIYGKFVKRVTLGEAATLGGPTTYGVKGVQLTK